jgi:oligopeptide transport system substrate-binding protein
VTSEEFALFQGRSQAAGVSRRSFVKVAAALAAALGGGWRSETSAARGTPGSPGEELASEQVVRVGGGGYFSRDPSSHDFSKDQFGGGHPALFAGLLRFNADFEAVPDLAMRVEPNAGNSVWTFHLRRDSKWSDGAPCTAHDFVWSWLRKLDPASAAPYASFLYDVRNAEAFNKGGVTDRTQVGLRARDDYTLEVSLEGPRSYFPVLTAFLALLPAYRPAVEKYGDKWTEAAHIVCNGPFVLDSWERGHRFVLKRNPHYYGARDVRLDRVIVPIIPLASGLLPFENDEVDFSLVPSGDVSRALRDPRLKGQILRYPRPQTWYLIPQVTRSPFDQLQVRQAVSHVIDRKAVARVANGYAIPADSMIPPGSPGHIDDPRIAQIQRFDPRAALAALKGTPFEGGKNWGSIVMSMREQGDGARPMAEAVQAMLLEYLNMRCELEVLDPKIFHQRLWKHDFQLVWIRWSMDYPDPHNEYFDTFYGGGSPDSKRQAWVNRGFDALVESARGESDKAKRLSLYRRAEEILQRDVGYVPVTWGTPYAALKPWVKGVPKNRLGEIVVDSNIYIDMLAHLYVVKRG